MKIINYVFRASWNDNYPLNDLQYPRCMTISIVADDEIEARRLLQNVLPQYKLRLTEINQENL